MNEKQPQPANQTHEQSTETPRERMRQVLITNPEEQEADRRASEVIAAAQTAKAEEKQIHEGITATVSAVATAGAIERLVQYVEEHPDEPEAKQIRQELESRFPEGATEPQGEQGTMLVSKLSELMQNAEASYAARQKESERAARERERVAEHEMLVGQMKELIQDLPLEYIPVPDSADGRGSGAVLLRIKGTESAFLVSDDLRKSGSEYGLLVGDEKIFFRCGCKSCVGPSNWNDDWRAKEQRRSRACSEAFRVAADGGITTLITRYMEIPYSDGGTPYYPGIKTVDVETIDHFIKTGESSWRISEAGLQTETIKDVMSAHGLIPTRARSGREKAENEKRVAEANEELEQRNAAENRRRAERDAAIEKLLALESESAEADPAARQKVNDILSEVDSSNHLSIAQEIASKLKYTPSRRDAALDVFATQTNFNVLEVSVHDPEGTNWHFPAETAQVDIDRGEDGSITFSYGRDKVVYRVVYCRSGLDGTDLIIGATPLTNLDWQKREDGTLELYTDVSYLDVAASPMEKIVFEETGYHLPTKDEILAKASQTRPKRTTY